MKSFTTLILITLLALFPIACTSSKDSVKMAKQKSEQETKFDSKKGSDFLIEMADARLMDREEGKLAKVRGTTSEIRQYGELMITEQTGLLAELNELAKKENVTLPETISDSKADGLNDLKKLNGKKFDKKFISMITIDHERDVKEFRKVAQGRKLEYSDEVMNFAQDRLPQIQQHLDKINKIEKR